MRCIYRIVCLINGKNYVGQAKDFNDRRNNHSGKLRRKEHPNPDLQSDWNVFGVANFYIELVEQNISAKTIDLREKFWITHFDSFSGGYNKTPDGRSGSISKNSTIQRGKKPPRPDFPCTWNGIDYPGIAACARANKVLTATMRKCILQGYTSDEDYPPIQKMRREKWATQHQAHPRSRKSAPDVLSTNAPNKGRIS